MRPVGLQQSSSLSAARERMQKKKKKKKNAQGSAEGGARRCGRPKRDRVGNGWSLFLTATRIAFTCECRDIQQEPT